MNSIVKSLDVNEDENIVMRLKNWDIIIKHYKNKNKIEEVFLKTHSIGEVGGIVLFLIQEKFLHEVIIKF